MLCQASTRLGGELPGQIVQRHPVQLVELRRFQAFRRLGDESIRPQCFGQVFTETFERREDRGARNLGFFFLERKEFSRALETGGAASKNTKDHDPINLRR